MEADPRHGGIIVEQLSITSSVGTTAAGAQNEEIETAAQEEGLDPSDITLFRGIAHARTISVPTGPR